MMHLVGMKVGNEEKEEKESLEEVCEEILVENEENWIKRKISQELFFLRPSTTGLTPDILVYTLWTTSLCSTFQESHR